MYIIDIKEVSALIYAALEVDGWPRPKELWSVCPIVSSKRWMESSAMKPETEALLFGKPSGCWWKSDDGGKGSRNTGLVINKSGRLTGDWLRMDCKLTAAIWKNTKLIWMKRDK
jgi:hypothetical protein